MPELPEVETMRRGIAGVVGSRIRQVGTPRCKLKPIALSPSLATIRRRIVGKAITGTNRVGKRVVLELEDGDRIVFEPRMTGLVLVADPPNLEHLRFRLGLDGGRVGELLFWDRRGLGSVRLASPQEFAILYGPPKLGPDALTVTPEILRDQLGSSRRPIKVALLDQRGIAGIGNLYASEILHVCRISPHRPANRLRPAEWRSLAEAVLAVLQDAILHEGSTLSDGTYRNALNQAGGYQNHHRVYDRASQKCQRCDGVDIVRIVQAQRSTFYCPGCQPASGRRSRKR